MCVLCSLLEAIHGNNHSKAPPLSQVGVVGAGAMGRGIAQICAQAGLKVQLFDTVPDASEAAPRYLEDVWRALETKGKLTDPDVEAALSRLQICSALDDLRSCDLVIEAIVERLDVKRDLVAKLEAIVFEDAIIASNSSSLSITAIGAAAKRPQRFVGYHFFNPVPLMKSLRLWTEC
jgi:3-hydroxybutyryl-CoA dehydrogenase